MAESSCANNFFPQLFSFFRIWKLSPSKTHYLALHLNVILSCILHLLIVHKAQILVQKGDIHHCRRVAIMSIWNFEEMVVVVALPNQMSRRYHPVLFVVHYLSIDIVLRHQREAPWVQMSRCYHLILFHYVFGWLFCHDWAEMSHHHHPVLFHYLLMNFCPHCRQALSAHLLSVLK